jgi:hypothetical protein
MTGPVAGKQYRKDEDHAARQISPVHVWHPTAGQAMFPRLRFTLVISVISSKDVTASQRLRSKYDRQIRETL